MTAVMRKDVQHASLSRILRLLDSADIPEALTVALFLCSSIGNIGTSETVGVANFVKER